MEILAAKVTRRFLRAYYMPVEELADICLPCAEKLVMAGVNWIPLVAADFKPPAGPPELGKYYSKCRERYDDKEYCARVAWNIYCSHVNPGYEGCTQFGKKWGPPYSGPKSK